jgi:protein ImuA
MEGAAKNEIIQKLKSEILLLQGFKAGIVNDDTDIGLGPIAKAFPTQTFLTGAIHELISDQAENAVATNGFISAVAGRLMRESGCCVWVSNRRTVFPPALRQFGMQPDRVLFADVHTQKEALWVIEEALKCNMLTAVIGEIAELSFADSRRLQLAVEKSKVTGFIHRYRPRTENTTACVTRWRIRPTVSITPDDMPGMGFPCWDIQLLKVRNGQPGRWLLEWRGAFRHLSQKPASIQKLQTRKKTG